MKKKPLIPELMPEHLEESPRFIENNLVKDLEGVLDRYSGAVTSVQVLGAIRLLELRQVDRMWPRETEE